MAGKTGKREGSGRKAYTGAPEHYLKWQQIVTIIGPESVILHPGLGGERGRAGELGRRDHVAGEGLFERRDGVEGRGHPHAHAHAHADRPARVPARLQAAPRVGRRAPGGVHALVRVPAGRRGRGGGGGGCGRGGRGRGRLASHDGLVTVRRRGAPLRVGSLAGAGRRAPLLRGLRLRGLRGLRWLRRGRRRLLVVLGLRQADLRGEGASEDWVDVVREVLEEHGPVDWGDPLEEAVLYRVRGARGPGAAEGRRQRRARRRGLLRWRRRLLRGLVETQARQERRFHLHLVGAVRGRRGRGGAEGRHCAAVLRLGGL